MGARTGIRERVAPCRYQKVELDRTGQGRKDTANREQGSKVPEMLSLNVIVAAYSSLQSRGLMPGLAGGTPRARPGGLHPGSSGHSVPRQEGQI